MWLYCTLFRRLKYNRRNMEIKRIMQERIRIEAVALPSRQRPPRLMELHRGMLQN